MLEGLGPDSDDDAVLGLPSLNDVRVGTGLQNAARPMRVHYTHASYDGGEPQRRGAGPQRAARRRGRSQ